MTTRLGQKVEIFKGVRVRHGRYIAVAKRNGELIKIGEAETAEMCALLYDQFQIKKRGLLACYPDLLNFPKLHWEAYRRLIAEREEQARREAAKTDARLRSATLTKDAQYEAHRLFSVGMEVEKLAWQFSVHPDYLRDVLRSIECDRLDKIGLSLAPIEVTGTAIRRAAQELLRNGMSLNAAAQKLEVDRGWLSRLLSRS